MTKHEESPFIVDMMCVHVIDQNPITIETRDSVTQWVGEYQWGDIVFAMALAGPLGMLVYAFLFMH
jgi:hypothetical protein